MANQSKSLVKISGGVFHLVQGVFVPDLRSFFVKVGESVFVFDLVWVVICALTGAQTSLSWDVESDIRDA